MKPRDRNASALDRLIAEARDEKTPAVNWDAMEAALVKRVGETPNTPARRRGTGVPLLFAAAALVLSVGAFLLLRGPAVHPDVAPVGPVSEIPTPRLPHHIDGDALALGAVVTSGVDEVVVEHRGHATWTLSPESAAHVESVGDIVAVALDRGIVTAKVVKSPKPESFIVRVEHTRIAVHGTRFRVVRLDSSVRVDVEEGVVGVGPVGKPGFDLRAPDGATVNFEGIRTDIPTAAAQSRHPSAGAAPTISAANQAQAHQKSFDLAPADEDGMPRGAQVGIDQTTNSVETCLRENTVSGGDLHVTVQTKMTLRVDGNGKVGEAVFAPPLAPNVGACVDAALEKISFPHSAGGFVAYRVLELSR